MQTHLYSGWSNFIISMYLRVKQNFSVDIPLLCSELCTVAPTSIFMTQWFTYTGWLVGHFEHWKQLLSLESTTNIFMDSLECCRHYMWPRGWGQRQGIDFDTGSEHSNTRPWQVENINSKTLTSPEALKAGWGKSEDRAKTCKINYLFDFTLIACQ